MLLKQLLTGGRTRCVQCHMIAALCECPPVVTATKTPRARKSSVVRASVVEAPKVEAPKTPKAPLVSKPKAPPAFPCPVCGEETSLATAYKRTVRVDANTVEKHYEQTRRCDNRECKNPHYQVSHVSREPGTWRVRTVAADKSERTLYTFARSTRIVTRAA